jgi:hypothetical protein
MYGNETALAATGLTGLGAIALSMGLMVITVGLLLVAGVFLIRRYKNVPRP